MTDLAASFPESIRYDISLDTTLAITAGINDIVETLFIALALVILVVFIFIQDWRAALIPTIAIPVSLVGAFIVFPIIAALSRQTIADLHEEYDEHLRSLGSSPWQSVTTLLWVCLISMQYILFHLYWHFSGSFMV